MFAIFNELTGSTIETVMLNSPFSSKIRFCSFILHASLGSDECFELVRMFKGLNKLLKVEKLFFKYL